MGLRFLDYGWWERFFHIPGNADVTMKLFMIYVKDDSKYSATGFIIVF